jgi:RNA polymerase-binding transcription factor DksA
MPKSKPKKAVTKKPKAAPAKASKPAAKVPASKGKAPAKVKPTGKVKTAAKAKTAVKVKTAVKAKVAVKAKSKAIAPVKKTTKIQPNVETAKKPAAKAVAKVKEVAAKKPPVKRPTPKAREQDDEEIFVVPRPKGPIKITPFQKGQREKLQALRDLILDSMAGVAKDTLRSRPEGGEASAFGMHQADAGSDAYDKDFALSLLSQEQDALYEIEEAMKRVDAGTYGLCEMSGKPIPVARLEALPFARYTVECQTEIERTKRHQRSRVPVTSLFGLTDAEEEDGDGEEAEETPQKPQTEE